MQINSGYINDHCRYLDTSGAYEWWYVDALSPDGAWGVVGIVFRGMPMSPDYLAAQGSGAADPHGHMGYAVSIYHHGRRVFFAFRGSNHIDVSQAANGKIGLGAVGHFDRHSIAFDTLHPDVRRRAKVTVQLTDASPDGTSSATPAEPHGWVLVHPRAQAHVALQILEGDVVCAEAEWDGLAYRDHNWGTRAMQDDFRHWYWGRVHAPDRTIIYLAASVDGTHEAWAGEVRDPDGVIQPWSDVVVTPQRHRLSVMGLWCPKTVKITALDSNGDRVTLVTQHHTTVENGPFYQRYLSSWMLNDIALGDGTSEYMNVKRYQRAWIRPFLRLPWHQHV